jgi:hypothetical protein
VEIYSYSPIRLNDVNRDKVAQQSFQIITNAGNVTFTSRCASTNTGTKLNSEQWHWVWTSEQWEFDQHVRFQCYVNHDVTPCPTTLFHNIMTAVCTANTAQSDDLHSSNQSIVNLWSFTVWKLVTSGTQKAYMLCYAFEQGCPDYTYGFRFYDIQIWPEWIGRAWMGLVCTERIKRLRHVGKTVKPRLKLRLSANIPHV